MLTPKVNVEGENKQGEGVPVVHWPVATEKPFVVVLLW